MVTVTVRGNDLIYRGYMGIMENNIETTIMEHQMEKNMENDMETI